MKITLIDVEDYKRIKKIVISPGERSLIKIAGKNKQGKSSLLGAMSAAIGGGKEAAEEPIRKGQKRADIKIEFDGDLVVHRKFLSSGSSNLEIKNKDGSKLSKPQQILDKLIGARFLSPLEFMRLPEKKQREVLLQCAKMDLDLDEHTKERKEVFEERTNVNRDVKRLTAELEASPDPGKIPDATTPGELLETLDALIKHDKEASEARHKLEAMRTSAKAQKETIADLEDRLKKAKDELAEFTKEGKEFSSKWSDIIEVDNTEEIAATREAVDKATASGEERVRLEAQKERHDKASKALHDATASAVRLTAALDELDAKKTKALSEADMPIKGLDVDEDRVLFGEVPLSQASGAEQLQVSLALAAAMSPELKDIWVEDGALLDEDSLELVHQFAKDNGLRIWLERVGVSDDDCIILEEGTVKT